jgi:hypothetical protein
VASSKDTRYLVAANHVVTDDQGRQFGPGDTIDVLPASDHNDALVSSGELVPLEAPPKRGRPKKAESESEDAKK